MASENTDLENARIADTQYLVRRSMTKNRLLRATWLGGVAGMCHRTFQCNMYISHHVHTGIGSGGAVEYVRSANSSPETLRSRRIRAALDVIPILALFDPSVTIF